MRHFLTVLIVIVVCGLGSAAELVPFSPPWDDTASGPTDLSTTLHKPAGKLGHVRVHDGHLYAGDQRLRIFGSNVTAGACYPDHETAEKVAGRMAKFGMNGLRFHFLDSTWGTPSLIDYKSGDWRNWDAGALDRFDYFVAQLKKRGIYINLNLLVGRRFGFGDKVDPKIDQLDWKAAHAVGFFHAPHMETQKAYARRLLTHRNPFTKRTYAEDPAVALVEINNENGLIHTWMSGKFDALPEPFAADLARQWNAWLAKRYADTSKLFKAWGARDEPLGAEQLNNAGFTQGLMGWNVEQHQGAAVDASVDAGAAVLRVRKTGSAGWHVQFNQAKLIVKKGGLYTVRFSALADRQRNVSFSVMQAHDPWGNLGLRTQLTLKKELQAYTFSFMAKDNDENARMGFSDLNQEGATFRFSDVSLKPGGRVGLAEGESLEKRNISAPKTAQARAMPAGGKRDWIRFLWETERAYWSGIQAFLKKDVGVKAPIVGTIVATSTPNLMGDLDVVDTHAYWQHPHFPGKPWDRGNWTVKNLSMVDHLKGATVAGLSFQRIAGKPHMVSEYNHPAPNTHAGEGPLFISTFGALQDWDAIFLYTYSHSDEKTKAGRIPDFFDIGQHPTIMPNVLVASLLFRRADVAVAKRVLRIPLAAEKEIDLIAKKGRAWRVLAADQLGIDLRNAVRYRVALDLTGKAPRPKVDELEGDTVASDTEEVAWSVPGKECGIFKVCSARTKAVLGHVDGQTIDLGDGVHVRFEKTRSGWCTLALTVIEGASIQQPRRVLLVATGIAENTNMGWKDAAKSTVGRDWGEPPSLVEPIAATVRLPKGASLPVLCPLNERGQRGKGVPAKTVGEGAAEFRIGPPHRTLWYEIDFSKGE